MEFPHIFWGVFAWMIVWAVAGSIATRRAYLRRDLDTSNASFVGAMLGASTGPLGLVPLWMNTPEITTRMMVVPTLASVSVLMIAFGFADPENFCVTNGSFVASQIVNGLIIGIIYGFMALGLTLIFSILGVVSFAHGEFYMIGGMLAYFLTAVWLPGINPVIAISLACFAVFVLGAVFEEMRHQPRHGTCAEILKRERRAVEEFEDVDAVPAATT